MRQDIVSMFDVSTCVSDDFPACLLSIDSYHSDLPEPITIIYVEIGHLYMWDTCRPSEFLSKTTCHCPYAIILGCDKVPVLY